MEKKTKVKINPVEPVKANKPEENTEDLALEIVKYLQQSNFKNDYRSMKIDTKTDALNWLKLQK